MNIAIILKKKYKTQENISKILGCSRRFYGNILKKERNPTTKLTIKMCNLVNIAPMRIIEKIIPKFNPYGSYITPDDFSIKLDAKFATLIGHVLGDGHLGKYFGYTNTNEILTDNVLRLVKKLPVHNLSFNVWEHNGKSFKFSTLIRDILICANTPTGNKILSKTFIPNWIKNADIKIKSEFLRALFDDEGCVSQKDRTILLSLSKAITLENNLEEFIRDIKKLLEDCGIKRISIKTYKRDYEGKNGKTVIKSLTFYGYFNFKIFKEKIGFSHPEKEKKLTGWIKNIQIFRLSKKERQDLFIKTLKENPFLTAKQISIKIRMHHHATLGYLSKLWNQELVEKTANEWPVRWYLSEKSQGIE